jgi:8-oxo-dGTP diphosphatase
MTTRTYTYPHPRPALTVDIVLIRAGHILLIQRGHPPFAGHWALPGGFVEENEPLEAAARRELLEETGLEPPELQQLGAFRDPRGWTISVAFWAHVEGDITPHAGDDAAAARWWPLNDLPPLAFDHADIISQLLTPSRRASPRWLPAIR